MLQKLEIQYQHEKRCYDILLEQNYESLSNRVRAMNLSNRKICVVTDTNIAPHHADRVVKSLEGVTGKVVIYTFPAGEANKNLDTVAALYEFLIRENFDRNDVLAALGGGVVGDLTGFTAATYLRGIRFFQLPTSLLAMVDSSIGGKTGVDFQSYKNMVGAFYMPEFVYINISTLQTLPVREYRSGFGEIIKHGLIKDGAFYTWLVQNREKLMELDTSLVMEMVYRSLLVKKEVVERDPKEKGERALLNFGHTIGHAVEKLKNFSLLHGECVCIGMAAALWLSCERGNLTAALRDETLKNLAAFELPVSVNGMLCSDLIKAAQKDKKMDAGQIRFILLKDIGEAYADLTVTQQEMEQACEFILK